MVSEFVNEPLTDFSDDANRQAFEEALARRKATFGQTYPLIIDGKEVQLETTFASTNPSRPQEVIGNFSKAGIEEMETALEVAWQAFETWSQRPAEERADYLFRAAAIMRARKHDFSAQMVIETGKSWVEADADTAESIDFLEFYGREAIRYAQDQPLTPIAGETNWLEYIPLGVGAVIPPWNFPNAILCGMSAAAVVTGNTVILKPASDSPGIGYMVAEMFQEVELPGGVLNFLSGPGSLAGNHLVEHAKTRFISFTGSMEVGLEINAKAAKTVPGQIWIKRLVAEMGGKDSIIVDKDADLESAASGIVAAAFGYQGQKCSACSRAILHKDIYDEVRDMVVEKTKQLTVGDPAVYGNFMGPVINGSAMAKHLEYMEIGKQEGKLLVGGGKHKVAEAEGGYFLEPTVYDDIAPDARLSQEEIFGPVLALIKAEDFDDAVKIFNNTVYGLTGAFYGFANKEEASRLCHCGNFYLNRKCTGALVGVHPFGGFNMSGTDSKAGGRDYLLLFMQAKLMSEANV